MGKPANPPIVLAEMFRSIRSRSALSVIGAPDPVAHMLWSSVSNRTSASETEVTTVTSTCGRWSVTGRFA